MAKSTGNIARVGEVLAAGVSPRALRLALISVHYRASLNHSDESLAAAGAALERLDAAVAALGAYTEDGPDDDTLPETLDVAREAFGAALDDDLNISAALAAVFDLVRDLNRRLERRSLSTTDAGRALATLRDLDRVLAILPDEADDLEPEVAALLDERAAARAARDFAASDRLRDELAAHGVTVEDTRDGQRWRRSVEAGHG
jgi:cysteinyl-tRNA synthetase